MGNTKQGQAGGQHPNILKRNITHKVNWRVVLASLAITALVASAWTYLAPRTNQAKAYKVLEAREAELTTKLEELNRATTQTQQLEETKQKLENEKKELQTQLEAKAQSKVYAEPRTAPVAVITGDCATWLAQAGVTDTASANELIRKESNCRVDATNPSSGAYGIPQALPASKIAHCGNDPVCQIKWMDKYCKERYGSWANALAFHRNNGWY